MFRANPNNRTITAIGEVGDPDTGFTVEQMFDGIEAMDGGPFTLRLSSEGGAVLGGLNIYNMIREHPERVDVEVNALVGSIATVIMTAGASTIASDDTRVMIHNSGTIAGGNAARFDEIANLLRGWDEVIAKAYARRSERPVEFWRDLMDKETTGTAAQFLEWGLIDQVRTEENADAVSLPIAAKSDKVVAKIGNFSDSFNVEAFRKRREIERYRNSIQT